MKKEPSPSVTVRSLGMKDVLVLLFLTIARHFE